MNVVPITIVQYTNRAGKLTKVLLRMHWEISSNYNHLVNLSVCLTNILITLFSETTLITEWLNIWSVAWQLISSLLLPLIGSVRHILPVFRFFEWRVGVCLVRKCVQSCYCFKMAVKITICLSLFCDKLYLFVELEK